MLSRRGPEPDLGLCRVHPVSYRRKSWCRLTKKVLWITTVLGTMAGPLSREAVWQVNHSQWPQRCLFSGPYEVRRVLELILEHSNCFCRQESYQKCGPGPCTTWGSPVDSKAIFLSLTLVFSFLFYVFCISLLTVKFSHSKFTVRWDIATSRIKF